MMMIYDDDDESYSDDDDDYGDDEHRVIFTILQMNFRINFNSISFHFS